MIKRLLFLTVLISAFTSAHAQYIGLENQVPTSWTTDNGATLSISGDHFKLGSQSVKWDWKQGATLTIQNPPNITNALSAYKGGMMLWVYNSQPVDKKIIFQFGKGNSVEYYFDYGINFKGWRACWIRFDQDMKGPKSSNDINEMRIIAPDDVAEGTLYFDRMMFPSTRIHDRVTPDKQLPYINPSMNDNHWAALWHWYDTYTHDIALGTNVTAEEQAAFDAIGTLMTESYKSGNPSDSKVATTKDKYHALKIVRSGDEIVGRPYVSDDEYDTAHDDMKMDQVGLILLDLARVWYHRQDTEARQMFFDVLDWVMDQGLNVGSGMGTNHHYGYNFREFPPAIFLMKDELKAAGRLESAAAMLNYWTGIQEYRLKPVVGTLQGLMDSWNTTVIPRLIAVMAMDDTPEKAREMKAIKRWMDISLRIVPGTMGGIKPDGCGFHHSGLYPAYSTGGYAGIGSLLRYVNGTCFQLSDEARINFGKGLIAMRNYCNHLSWGFGVCGRHPLSGNISGGVKNAFAYLAKSGDPYSDNAIWEDMAAAYMRLETSNTSFKQEFTNMGISAEDDPNGNYTYNYGALGIHRRGEWMVSVKGYNKHVWGSEIYTSDNRYGRYQSYGTVQVIGKGNPVSSSESGFVQDGWDWNRYPGGTYVHLPFDLLESPKTTTLMETSDEGFTGASNIGGEHGVFGMKLREKDRPNFTADHQANKSVFCFEDRIICLGSNISNSNANYPTETALFQVNLKNQSDVMYVDNGTPTSTFPLQQDLASDKNHYLVDPAGNGYWVKAGRTVKVARKTQYSRHNKTKVATQGDFASAWINHGTKPSGQTYEYVVIPNAGKTKIQEFNTQMMSEDTAPYKVLKQDADAHIVWDRATDITGYVFFDAVGSLSDIYIKEIDASALVMIKPGESNQMTMSVCDPDLHLEDTDVANASQESTVVLTLKGTWALAGQNDKVTILSADNGETRIQFLLVDGIPQEITLDHTGAVTGMEINEQEDPFEITGSLGRITVRSMKTLPRDTMVKIYDVLGREIASTAFNHRNEVSIAVTSGKGIYVVSIPLKNEAITRKVVMR